MPRRPAPIRLALGLAALAGLGAARAAPPPDVAERFATTTHSFEELAENLELAITGRGFVIDRRSYIAEMLRRTGQDLGLEG